MVLYHIDKHLSFYYNRIGMDEDKKKDSNTSLSDDNKKKHRKLKIYLTTIGSLFIIVCTIIYLTYLFTHRDSNRNPTSKVDNSNIQLIQKNLLDGFKNTKETGKYSFRISDEDINQILLNSCDDLLSGKEESCYISSDTSTFYVDYKPTLGVKTRVQYKFNNYGVNTLNEHFFILEDVPKMGSLPYMFGHRINFESFIKEVSKNSGLPLRWENAMLVASPVKLFDYFPSEDIKSFMKGLISAKPECILVDPNSLFGFDINLSLFKSNNIPTKEVSELLPDLYSQVSGSITPEFLSSIPSKESKEACILKVSDINKLISSKFTKKVIGHASLDLSDVEVILEVNDLYVSLLDTGHLTFVMPVSINGYMIYFINNSNITTSPNEMIMEIELSNTPTLNGLEIKGSYLGDVVISELSSVLTSVSSGYSYLSFVDGNKTWYFDFNDIITSILYEGSITPIVGEPSGFSVIVTSKI